MMIRAYLNGLYYVFICIGYMLTYYWIPYQPFFLPPKLSFLKEAWNLGIAEYMTKEDTQ